MIRVRVTYMRRSVVADGPTLDAAVRSGAAALGVPTLHAPSTWPTPAPSTMAVGDICDWPWLHNGQPNDLFVERLTANREG